MSEELKTIKELADELGVSKQGIQYHIKSLPNKKRLKNDKGIIVLDSEEQEYIRQKSRQNNQGKSDKDSQGKLGKLGKSDKDSQGKLGKLGKSDKDSQGKLGKDSQDKLGKDSQGKLGKDSQDKLGKDSQGKYLIEIKFLEEKNSIKDNQIEYLKFQIENLMEAQKQTQNLLDQQQRLALQDKKLLEEYKAENDSLKALKMPSSEFEKEQGTNQSQEEVERLRSENKALQEQLKEQTKIEEQEELNNQVSKKWYQFWKW